MKRLYSFMLSAVVATSAFAGNLYGGKTFSEFTGDFSTSKTEAKEVTKKFVAEKVSVFSTLERIAKAPRKVEESTSKYAGTYILTLVDDIFTNSTGAITNYEVDVTVNEGILTISSVDNEFDPITANIDEATGAVTFSNQYVGASTQYAFSYLPLDFNSEQMFGVDVVATFNEEATALTFPEDTGIMEGAWGWSNILQKNQAIAAAKNFDTNSTYFKGWYFGQLFGGMNKGGITYSSAGKVTYYDGLMTVNDAVNEIYSWDVDIEECDQQKGLYRLQPYAVENPVGTALEMGIDTETYIYINVSNPEKVFTKGQFSPYGVETFSGVNAENNFNGEYYGTYEEGIITFPEPSFAYTAEGKWYLVQNDGQPNLRIVFEGATIKDFTIEATTESPVSADNTWTVNVTKGEDVASVKYMVVPDDIAYNTLVGYGFSLDKFGTVVTGDSFTIDPVNNNILGKINESTYVTVYVGSYNSAGEEKEVSSIVLTVLFDDKTEGWATVGTTSFTDPFIAPRLGGSWTGENIEVQAMQNNSPIYRLVTPYANFPIEADLAGHTNALVIDATDPTWVSIPEYFSGVVVTEGGSVVAVGSVSALGYDKESVPTSVGVISLQENVVTMGSATAFIHIPYINDPGSWTLMSDGTVITLPAISIDVTVKDENGDLVEGATVEIASDSADEPAAQADVTTDAEGKATIDVPFSTGYFGKVNLKVNTKVTEVALNGAKNVAEVVINNSSSMIKEISSVAADKVIYDVQGRRVANPTKGLYIINGKKALVK